MPRGKEYDPGGHEVIIKLVWCKNKQDKGWEGWRQMIHRGDPQGGATQKDLRHLPPHSGRYFILFVSSEAQPVKHTLVIIIESEQ